MSTETSPHRDTASRRTTHPVAHVARHRADSRDGKDAVGRQNATGVASLSSATTALTAAVALAATAASVEGLAELIHATAAMTIPTAWAIGSVMDLAVIVLALQARDAVLSGRGGHLEMALTWVASTASGTASASWQLGHAGAQAAGVRLLLPLLAAGLWHLTIVGERATAAVRPARHQARTSRLMLDLALAQADTTETARARRRRRRAQRALLRHAASATLDAQGHDLTWWRTLVTDVAVSNGQPPAGPDAPDVRGDSDATNDTTPVADQPATTASDAAATDNTGTDRAIRSQDALAASPAGTGRKPSTRQLVADALRDSPDATNAQLHDTLGGICSIRTIQRHRRAIECARHDTTANGTRVAPSPTSTFSPISQPEREKEESP